jgi:hypothetical protein
MLERLLIYPASFLGVLAGIILAYHAAEEIRPYRLQLIFGASVLFSASICLPLIMLGISSVLWVPGLLFFFLLARLFFDYQKFAYPMLAATMFLLDGPALALQAFAIFALGLPLGSLAVMNMIRDGKLVLRIRPLLQAIFPFAIFLVVGLLDLLFGNL